jgi:hypothetical protein
MLSSLSLSPFSHSVWLLHVASYLCNTCFVHQPNEMLMHPTASLLHTWGLEVQPVLIMNVVSKEGHMA